MGERLKPRGDGGGRQLVKTFNFSALQMKMSFFQHKILIDDGFQILQWKYCNADLRESPKRFLQQSKSDDVDNAMVLIRFSLENDCIRFLDAALHT